MKRKKFCGLLLAVTCLVTAISGCKMNSSENVEVDPLDEVHVFGDDEITVRKLFECSDEVIRYAKYLNATGDYEYTFDSAGKTEVTKKTTSAAGPLEYECFRDENGKSSSILCGGVDYEKSEESIIHLSSDYTKHEQAKYYYYKTFDTTYVKDLFIHYGSEDICGSIDIEKILLPDIESLSIEHVGYLEDYGVYCITVSGDPSPIRSAFDGNLPGVKIIDEIDYEFDAETHELVCVTLSGMASKENKESNDRTYYTDCESFLLNIEIQDVSYKEAQLPEMPQSISNNGYINDIILNDLEFRVKEDIINPFDIESEFYSVADNVWADVTAMPESDRNTLKELKTAIEVAASTYEMDVVDCNYSLLSYESYSSDDFEGVLLKFSICGQENVEGYFIIPVIIEGNNIRVSPTIALDKKDYGAFYDSGDIDFIHDCSPSCQLLAKYRLSADAKLTKEYSEVKEARLSNLTDQAELVYFPEEDWDNLKRMAEDLEAARVASISYYEVRSTDTANTSDFTYFDPNYLDYVNYVYEPYYVLDVDLAKEAIEGIGDTFSINLVSKSSMDNWLKDRKNSKEQNNVKWVQILDE